MFLYNPAIMVQRQPGQRDAFERLKNEAGNKDIYAKACLAAKNLGSQKYSYAIGGFVGDEYTYSQNNLEIKYRLGHTTTSEGEADVATLSVDYEGREVFTDGLEGMRTFYPGAWERQLNLLHKRARIVEQQVGF